MTPVVNFPNICTLENIFNFCSEIEKLLGAEEIHINFSNMGRIEPFGMIYIAKYIKNFNPRSRNTKIFCYGHETKNYAANMGFFRAFGLKHGREPNCNTGNSRFVPYTIIRVRSIIDEAAKEWQVEQQIIEDRATELAKILTQENNGDLIDTLSFSIREMIRNIYEHSDSKQIEYCAQYWPTLHKVEISIGDSGIGLRESLKSNPHIQVETDSDAIQQALMPAVSSKNYEGAIVDSDDPWHNSGFGLYMSSRICRQGGSFTICSGNHAIVLNEGYKTHHELPHPCKGTVIRMVLNIYKLSNLKLMLSQFAKEGYEIAKQIKGVGFYEASAASKMLSRDFKNDD